VSAPDPLTALGQRVTALTGRDLRRDQLETVIARAFEHDLNLGDDAQLRALVAGLPAGDSAQPPISHAPPPPAWGHPNPTPAHPQPGYPQPGCPQPAHPAQPWAGHPPAPAPPVTPMRRPAAFPVAGPLLAAGVIAALTASDGALNYRNGHLVLDHLMLFGLSFLLPAAAFALVAYGARPAGQGLARRAALVAAAAILVTLATMFASFLIPNSPTIVLPAVLPGIANLVFAVTLVVFAARCRPIFRMIGVLTGTVAGILGLGLPILLLVAAWQYSLLPPVLFNVLVGSWLVAQLFLLIFAITVTRGRLPRHADPARPGPA